MTALKRIGVIFAMEEEGEVLKEHLSSIEILRAAPYSVVSAHLNDKQVLMINSGIGKVNAAIAATLLIENYQPELILNIGIAGAVAPELKVGDVLMADACAYYDVDATVFGYQHGQVPRMPTHFQSLLTEIKHNADFVFKVAKGMLCTGDSFLTTHDRIRDIKKIFPNIMAVDMEGAAIAQACHQFKVPFIMIKGISDQVDHFSKTDSENNVAVAMGHAGQVLVSVIDMS